MQKAIIFEQVCKEYRIPSLFPWKASKTIEALKNASFSCPEGKITCLLGPNGAGKTTIIKILAGLVSHEKGDIFINNMLLIHTSKISSQRIGVMASNDRSFYWRLTGRQNLEFFCSLYNYKGKEMRDAVSKILFEIEIDSEADKPFRLYSSGIKQKFLLARALLCDPDILLLDEPTSHIDPIATENIHNLIINKFIKKRKKTVLLCTHDLYEVQKLADYIILLNEGAVIAEGELSQIRSMINPSVKFVMQFSRVPKKSWTKGLPMEIISEKEGIIELITKNRKLIPRIVDAAINNNGKIMKCMENEETILEIFSRLASGAVK